MNWLLESILDQPESLNVIIVAMVEKRRPVPTELIPVLNRRKNEELALFLSAIEQLQQRLEDILVDEFPTAIVSLALSVPVFGGRSMVERQEVLTESDSKFGRENWLLVKPLAQPADVAEKLPEESIFNIGQLADELGIEPEKMFEAAIATTTLLGNFGGSEPVCLEIRKKRGVVLRKRYSPEKRLNGLTLLDFPLEYYFTTLGNNNGQGVRSLIVHLSHQDGYPDFIRLFPEVLLFITHASEKQQAIALPVDP